MKTLCFLAVLTIGAAVYGEGGISFALIRGAEVTGTELVSEYSTKSLCHCRRLCFVTPGCNGASYVEEADAKHCRTFAGGFFSNPFGLKDNATLILRNTTRHWFHIGIDGRIYLVFGRKYELRYVINQCERIPGFHLGVYKDLRSTKVLQEIHESFGYDDVAVHLRFDNSRVYWADNTPFEQQIYQAEIFGRGYYYMLQSRVYKRVTRYAFVNGVCQADLQNGKH